MADCKSYAYAGFGHWARENMHYTQAIRVGDRIICSGQGGWDPKNADINFETVIPEDLEEEIGQAFANCEHNLKDAGGKGWSQVYKIVTYSTDIPAQTELIVKNLRKWMPNHAATWTEVGVKELGVPTMRFEIEVEAYDSEGAKSA